MADIGFEVEIAAPVTILFAVVTDIAGLPDVVRAIEATEIIAGTPPEPGSRYRETRRMMGHLAHEDLTVERCEPPQRFVVTAASYGTRYRTTWAMRPGKAGSVLAYRLESAPQTLKARLLAFATRGMRRHLVPIIQADLADVKAEAERRAAAERAG